MSLFKTKQNKAFTLIELLVVIAIISLLSSIVFVSLNTARAKGRDARRLSDMKAFQLAFEQAKADGKVLPSGILTYRNTGVPVIVNFLSPAYMSKVPTETHPKDTTNLAYLYYYCNNHTFGKTNLCFNDTDNYTYAISFWTETKTIFGNSGRYCLTSQGIFPVQTMVDPIAGIKFLNKCLQR